MLNLWSWTNSSSTSYAYRLQAGFQKANSNPDQHEEGCYWVLLWGPGKSIGLNGSLSLNLTEGSENGINQ